MPLIPSACFPHKRRKKRREMHDGLAKGGLQPTPKLQPSATKHPQQKTEKKKVVVLNMENSLYNKKENTKSVQSCLKDHNMYKKHKNHYRAQTGKYRALVLSSVIGV